MEKSEAKKIVQDIKETKKEFTKMVNGAREIRNVLKRNKNIRQVTTLIKNRIELRRNKKGSIIGKTT